VGDRKVIWIDPEEDRVTIWNGGKTMKMEGYEFLIDIKKILAFLDITDVEVEDDG
jgi:hypothetical protein